MSNEHFGALEAYRFDDWGWIVRTEQLLVNENHVLASLFGVDQRSGFRALFPERGLPPDVNPDFAVFVDRMKQDGVDVWFASWLTIGELHAIPWDEVATDVEPCIHKYRVAADGSEHWLDRDREFAELGCVGFADSTSHIRLDEHVYRRVPPRRRDLLDEESDFPALLELAGVLAARYGEQNVRLTVIFTS